MTTGRIGVYCALGVVACMAATYWWWPAGGSGTAASTTVVVRRGPFERIIRATGTVEAVHSATAVAPRLQGQTSPQLVVTRLVPGGSVVRTGDLLVEFDRQDQITAAHDRRAEYLDLVQQIQRKQAEQAASRAADDTSVKQAENDVGRAELEARKNRLLPRIDAEKNDLALEQARARLAQLREGAALRTRAAAADLRILEIRRDRAEQAMRHAEQNANLMSIHAPFEGLVVLKSTYKGSQMAEVVEGDQIYSGTPVLDVVDPSRMQVRVRVNQADGGTLAAGQTARIHLDAYPGLAFDGRVEEITPLAVQSSMTPKVRTFIAVISVAGTHEHLLPDLSAAADITVARIDSALLLPREAIGWDGEGTFVRVRQGRSYARQAVDLAAMSPRMAAIASGVAEGAVVAARAR